MKVFDGLRKKAKERAEKEKWVYAMQVGYFNALSDAEAEHNKWLAGKKKELEAIFEKLEALASKGGKGHARYIYIGKSYFEFKNSVLLGGENEEGLHSSAKSPVPSRSQVPNQNEKRKKQGDDKYG